MPASSTQCGKGLGRKHQQRDQDPAEWQWQVPGIQQPARPSSQALGHADHSQQGQDQQHAGAQQRRRIMVRRFRLAFGDAVVGEEVPVSRRLHEEEDAVEDKAARSDEEFHGIAHPATRTRSREPRQHHGDRGQRDQQRQVGVAGLRIELPLLAAPAGDQHARTQEQVQDQHDHREHGVAREVRVALRPEHDRADRGDFDDDRRDREDDGAQRLAEPLGHVVCMRHGAHGCGDDRCDEPRRPRQAGRAVSGTGRPPVRQGSHAGGQAKRNRDLGQDQTQDGGARRDRHAADSSEGSRRSAGAPSTQHDAEVAAVGGAVAVEVARG